MASMADPSKAREYVKQADAKLKNWIAGFFGGNKYEEALDLYEKAANQFKLAKCFKEAAEAYVSMVGCHLKLDSKHEAASTYVEAANMYKKCSPRDAVGCMDKAVELFVEMGRLNMAAKNLQQMAEVYEKDNDPTTAIQFYQRAAEFYATEDQTSVGNNCNLKVAALSATLEKFKEAAALFEEVASKSVGNNLLKYSSAGYLLNAGLCMLAAGDIEATKEALERYQDLDASFSDKRECKFLVDLAEAFEEGDEDKFTEHIAEFDSMTRLDPWKTKLLLACKKQLVAAAEGEGEDLT